jgi:hypothetical protein
VVRVGTLFAIVAAACLLRPMLIGLNPDTSNWAGPMWPIVAATLTLAILVPTLFPGVFAQGRVARMTMLAVSIPLAAYVFSISFSGVSI